METATIPRSPIAHGTTKGYQQHIRYRIPTCEDCRDANAAYNRDYRLRTGRSHSTRISLAALASLLDTAPSHVLAKIRAEIGDELVNKIHGQAA